MSNVYFTRNFERSFGTYPMVGTTLGDALRTAINIGYRSIDTAQMYENEAEIGAILSTLPVSRDALYITTKVHPDHYHPSMFLKSVEASLSDLRLDYVDVLLLHWPPKDADIRKPVHLLEMAYKRGMTKHIGVSNFTSSMMKAAKDTIETPLAVNQVEFHALLPHRDLMRAALETGISLASYCSLARGMLPRHPLLQNVAAQYCKSPAQIALRWILQQGVSIITMSQNAANIAANFSVMNFTLSSVDMARIDTLAATRYRVLDQKGSRWAPTWNEF